MKAEARSLVLGGVEVHLGPQTLVLRRIGTFVGTHAAPIPEMPRPSNCPARRSWIAGRVVATLDPDAPRDETLDLDRLVAPLSIRACPVPGDRFQPLGMGGNPPSGTTSFAVAGFTSRARERIPPVCDRLGIVWRSAIALPTGSA